jgi:hypothetical protein
MTCKGTLRQVLIKVYRLRFSQSCWYSLNVAPLTLSLIKLSPLPLFPVSKYSIFRQCLAGRVGVGVLSCVGDHILQEFNTLYLPRFGTYKIVLQPQTKIYRRGEGLRQINTCHKAPIYRSI